MYQNPAFRDRYLCPRPQQILQPASNAHLIILINADLTPFSPNNSKHQWGHIDAAFTLDTVQ